MMVSKAFVSPLVCFQVKKYDPVQSDVGKQIEDKITSGNEMI